MGILVIGTLLANLILFAILTLLAWDFRLHLNRRKWIFLGLIVFLGFCLRLAVTKFSENFMSVGWSYINIAASLKDTGILTQILSNRTIGYPLIISWVFRLFGTNYHAIFFTNILIGSFDIILFFVLLRQLFRKDNIAMLGALIFAIEPILVRYTSSNASNSVYYMFMLIAMIYILRKPSLMNSAVAGLALIYTQIVRYEFILACFVGIMYIIARVKHNMYRITIAFLFVMISTISILTIVNTSDALHTDATAELTEGVYTAQRAYHLLIVADKEYFKLVLSHGLMILLFIIGLVHILRKKLYEKHWHALIFILLSGVLINLPYIFTRFNYRYMGLGIMPFLIVVAYMSYYGISTIQRSAGTGFAIVIMSPLLLILILHTPYDIPNADGVSDMFEIINLVPSDSVLVAAGCGSSTIVTQFGSQQFMAYKNLVPPEEFYLVILDEFTEDWEYDSYCNGHEAGLRRNLEHDYEISRVWIGKDSELLHLSKRY